MTTPVSASSPQQHECTHATGSKAEPVSRIPRDWRSTTATFVAGAVAGACSRTLTAPFDRIKTIVQEGHLVDSGTHKKLNAPRQSRLVEVCRLIHGDGGWRAFWRGNGVNCMKAGPEFAIVFSLRRQMLSALADRKDMEALWIQTQEAADANDNGIAALGRSVLPSAESSPILWATVVPSIVLHFLVGASAGAGAQLALYPLEVVKTRIAVSTSSEFAGGIREVISEAYRKGGFREFYKGLLPTMVGIFLYRGFEVGLYSNVQAAVVARRRKEGRTKLDSQCSVAETAAIGTLASIVAQTLTYPFNVVRTRMQTQGLQGRVVQYCGMCDCMRHVYVKHGVRGLFRGLSANYIKAVPASAITFVVFEQTQNLLLGVE